MNAPTGKVLPDLSQRLAALEAREAALAKREAEVAAQAAKRNRIWFKIGEKGAIGVYGLNVKFPVSLYLGQWERFLSDETQTAFRKFIADNRHLCATK